MQAEKKLKQNDLADVITNPNCVNTLLFSPFNPANRQVTPADVCAILVAHGLPPRIHNFELYRRAFIHKSYITRSASNIVNAPCPPGCIRISSKSNERLEFLGDGVLEQIAKFHIYARFPTADEGFMTDVKVALVNNEALGTLITKMGLNQLLVLSRSAEAKGQRHDLKRLGCLFEAFLGALFLDYEKAPTGSDIACFAGTGLGMQASRVFAESIFSKYVDWTEVLANNSNHKNALQILLQKTFAITPEYRQLNEGTGGDFAMGVFLCIGFNIHHVQLESAVVCACSSIEQLRDQVAQSGGRAFLRLGVGHHRLKKSAEQLACLAALEKLNAT
jgi:dsRNA-specific ribonuclease